MLAPATGGSATPGYSSPSTRSNSCASSPSNAGIACSWVISSRSPGCRSASRVSTEGISANSTDWNEATRRVPRTSVAAARSSASASSSRSRIASVCVTSRRASGVSRTPRPTGSSRVTPVSVSSWLSCWEIADGL